MPGTLLMAMKSGSLAVTIIFLSLAAWSQAAQSLRTRIPPADAKLYKNLETAEDWKNPFLIVQPNGIVLLIKPLGLRRIISIDNVASALESLPKSAWPYGLVVALSDTGVLTREAAPRVARNRKMLLNILRNLGITIDAWPSA